MAMPKLPTWLVEPVDRQEHRLGDEIEPAPVDQQVEAVEAELLVVAVDDRDFLGAGEQPRLGRAGRARRDGLRVAEIVGLIGLLRAGLVCRRTAPGSVALVSGSSVAAQYLSVMPSQALVALNETFFLSSIVLVGELLQPLSPSTPIRPFVQDVVAERLRRAVARDQRVGIERDRRARPCWRPRPRR